MEKVNLRNKRGISLIVLVITIIVIIILAVAVILSISNNNPIENARRARDIWNEKTFGEEITTLLASNQLKNEDLATFFENSSDFDEVRTEPDSLVTVIRDDMAAIVDSQKKKFVGIISKKLIDEVAAMKAQFEANKENIVEETNIVDADTIKKYISLYSDEAYSFRIVKKYNGKIEVLVCEDQPPMTRDKILACEANGIYLWGDINKNYELEYIDEDFFIDYYKKNVEEFTIREKIVVDLNGDGTIDAMDLNMFEVVTVAIIDKKYSAYINKVKTDFEDKMGKVENRESITIKNCNDVMRYIPSHTNSKFELWIIRGNLVCAPNTSMDKTTISKFQTNGIILLGDTSINVLGRTDNVITSKDVDALKGYIDGTYTVKDEYLERFKIAADINGDGVIDSNDVVELEKLVK